MKFSFKKSNKSFDLSNFSLTRWFSYTSTTETIKGWPKLIASYEDIPSTFKESNFFDTAKIPYSVLIPEDVVVLRDKVIKTSPKLISLYDDRINILEQDKDKIKLKCHYLTDIYYVKHESVLLSSSISIVSSSGISSLCFNAVRDDLIEPIVKAIRKSYNKINYNDSSMLNHKTEILKFGELDNINCKFINYGVSSMIVGQNIKKMIYQETINLRSIKKGLFKWINNFTSPLLLTQTNDELVIIEEPTKIRSNKKLEYGGIYTYIPLKKIKRINLNKDVFWKMEIELLNDETICLFFSRDKELNEFRC